MPILFTLQTLFSLWMLYDAVSRHRERYWWFLVMMPFGEVVYFFAVYWPERGRNSGLLTKLLTRPPTIAELRRDYAMTPSLNNKQRLALGLHDAGDYAEAGRLFSELLGEDPGDLRCLFGYAQCLVASGDAADRDEAIRALTHLNEDDQLFMDGEPAFQLSELLWDEGQHEAATDVLRRLCKSTHRMRPHAELAARLVALGEDDEARAIIARGLDSFETSPRAIRKLDARHARAARRIEGDLGR